MIEDGTDAEKLIQLARRMFTDKNYSLAKHYYQDVMERDPDSWEAYFYANYCEVITVSLYDIPHYAQNLTNCYNTVLDMIFKTVSNPQTRMTYIASIASNLIFMAYTLNNEIMVKVNSDKDYDLLNSTLELAIATYAFGDAIDKKVQGAQQYAIRCCETAIELDLQIYKKFSRLPWSAAIGRAMKTVKKYAQDPINLMKKYNPAYKPPRYLKQSVLFNGI